MTITVAGVQPVAQSLVADAALAVIVQGAQFMQAAQAWWPQNRDAGL